jgi:hypothetical protein
MMDKQATDVLKSKKFWTLIIGLLVMLLVSLVPDLEQDSDKIIESLTLLISIAIGGYAIQDYGKEKYSNGGSVEDVD